MQFHIKGAAIEAFLTEVVKAFADLQPAMYQHFCEHVERESAALLKKSGMSADGSVMNKMYIPALMYAFIKEQARCRLGIENFWADRENYYTLCKVWPAAKTKTKPTPFFDPGAAKCRRLPAKSTNQSQ
jgi:hypothetical protein